MDKYAVVIDDLSEERLDGVVVLAVAKDTEYAVVVSACSSPFVEGFEVVELEDDQIGEHELDLLECVKKEDAGTSYSSWRSVRPLGSQAFRLELDPQLKERLRDEVPPEGNSERPSR